MLLRPAEPDDALAVARVHVRSWQAAYRSLLPDDYLDNLRAEERAQQYDLTNSDPEKPWTIVADEDGAIHGFATTMPSRDTDLPNHGELCALYVDPAQWGRGIGAALVVAARARMVKMDFRMRCCGCWQVTYAQSAFTGSTDGRRMARIALTLCGAQLSTNSASSAD